MRNQPAYISVIHRRCTPLGRRGGCTNVEVKVKGGEPQLRKKQSQNQRHRAQRNLTGHSISEPVVERLTEHRSRREKRGGANTTGTVTIEKTTPGRGGGDVRARLHESIIRDGTFGGSPRSGGVRAATSCATTLIWSDLSSYAKRDAFDFDFAFS